MKLTILKKDKYCAQCKSIIKQGQQCLMIKRPCKERSWICINCTNKLNNLISAQNSVNDVPNEDKGGYLAAIDNLHNAIDKLYE